MLYITWWTALQIPVLLLVLYLFSYTTSRSSPTLAGKRICLLIAHPDDEAMFFGPTLLLLNKPELANQVFILCLSAGNAEGLGQVRKQELVKSALLLGVKSSEHVVIIDDTKLPDSMSANWDVKLISSILTRYFAPKAATTPVTTAPPALIDVLITFDKDGVSGHPNHRSLYHGASLFLQSLMQRHSGWESPVKLYTLSSVNILRKYSSVLDSALTVTSMLWQSKDRGSNPTPLLIISGPVDIWKAQKAMTTAHKSQMRWFRYGWIWLSRYMLVNDLKRQKVV
ncbi:hypothetical protein BAUCODRAFT_415244 [Baudoinia panamericana UAMH 10762]|uniref:N-acetylglucosaminylphosphatidylinositol deacetylase n=1 Tax=Baudoinia panamericana (strain UAMH 10762) TaxID=717646 RepID=M2LUD5_BAUPA|nr:uncharacterized protein BAUCODRAFT_415244 [Baudoinia panamericana UAMH 10762]EMC98182.1 hypothetical protein BAUCODRAFT_415244 [Baudoinia panamericana UAMH 10762]